MKSLHTLTNTTTKRKPRKRVGRGPGSGLGKTSGRGQKGQGARSGYKRRYGFEGGGLPLYRKLPTRGFTRGRFQKKLDVVNLAQIEKLFEEGEEVSCETLKTHGFLSGKSYGVKLLANGELTKKVTFKLKAISNAAKEKLDAKGIKYTLV